MIELGKWKEKAGNTVSIVGVDRTHQSLKQHKATIAELPVTEKDDLKL